MTESRDDITDIAWLRGLAEDGARTPMRGSAILFAAGLIYGSASLVHWAVTSGLLAAPTTAFNLLWLGATALFLVVVVVVNLRIQRGGGMTTTANRAAGAAWMGVGWGIFALFGSLGIIGIRMGPEAAQVLLGLIPSVIMVFYGIGWAVTAAMQTSRPLGALATASFIAAPVLALMSGSAGQYLAYAAALFGLMAVPGFLLMRAAKA